MTSCVLTVNEQKQAVIALVGGVNAEVRQLLLKYIDQIWCAALQHSCEYPLTFLYAQREAIDFALAKLAPLVNQKRGKTDAFRTAEGFTRSKAEAKTTQRNAAAALAAIGLTLAAMLRTKTILIRGLLTVQRQIVLHNPSTIRTHGTGVEYAMMRKVVQPMNDDQETRAEQNLKITAIR
jgi:hypothetical protein